MMSINRNGLLTLVVMLAVAVVSIEAATFTVSKDGRGQYNTIQGAINKAGPNDSVIILDVATYPEQVTIDSTKPGLTLTSSTPTSLNKPKIVYQDNIDVGPKTCTEAKGYVDKQFDKNGALQLLRTHGVTVNGIAIDAGGPKPFAYPGVWSTDAGCTRGGCNGQPCPLFHGNAAIALWISGDIIIKNCDISNGYFGIALKDRNEGGIFANANPSDVQPWNVVPLSWFARTGNHLFEYNRIHNNSWAFFTESIWDLGSTIRYNLFYENRHASTAAAAAVKALPDGANQPGGCFRFKDHMLSPLSIYNNTFWHNSYLYIGDWQAGPQHLIFNNIYAQPFMFWSGETFQSPFMEMDVSFVNRMHNCTYAAQVQKPDPYSVQIMNGFSVAASGIVQQGASIGPFPVSANIRWAEPTFLSTDPTSSNFLVPDWSDTNVQKTIEDKGWVESGVKDPDGTIADLGAIPKAGGRPADLFTVKPTFPVTINGTTATLSFNVTQRVGTMTNPVIKYIKYINKMVFQSGKFGAPDAILPGQIVTIAVPPTPLKIGSNTLSITIPANDTSTYAFFEIIIEGTGSDGKLFTTATGFLPYRKLDYKFVVEIWDLAKAKKLDTVTVGDTVWLRLKAYKMDGTLFPNKVDSVLISLEGPGDSLYTPGTPPVPLTLIPEGVTITVDKLVMFFKVPPGNVETIYANGTWKSGGKVLPIPGTGSVYVKPGKPDKIVFQNPPSNSFKANPPRIDPGPPFTGSLYVYDRFGNRVDAPTTVTLSSQQPLIGDISGPKTITTDSKGAGTFGIIITKGNTTQLFTITGALGTKTDDADCIVGQPRDRLWIFYTDTAAYAPLTTTLQGQVGDRLKITIMAGKNALLDSITKVATSFTISGSSGLLFYSSPTAAAASTSFTLTNGRVDIWVTSATAIANGSVTANSDTNLVLSSDPRGNIFFIKPLIAIDSAFYYADNGLGQVNRAEVYYKDTMAMAPDSMVFFWPERTAANKKLVPAGSAIVMDPNKKHLTITIPPYPIDITTGDVVGQLGTTYQKVTVGATDNDSSRFTIKERVGPLVMTASVVERLTAGVDTLYATFSENLKAGTLVGASLILIQNGTSSVLTVDNAVLTGTTYKLTLAAGSVQPQLGDSLRINPAGPLADALGNTAHSKNRPVALSMKGIPASITSASYFDRNADGTVETVVMKFNKKVTLADLVVAVDWGGTNKLDSIATSRLSFVGTDGMTVELNIGGLFTGITVPKTSGAMYSTVSYRNMPGQTVSHDIADSAAPVLTLAVYHPGKSSKTEKISDTLWLDFSEPLGTLQSQTGFLLRSTSKQTPYSVVVNTTALSSTGTHRSFLVTSINGVSFPSKGDSIWIDPASNIADISNAVQSNANNRRVVLDVLPVPYDVGLEISGNPFTPGTKFNFDGIQGNGILIQVAPNTPLMDNIVLSATGRIYDAMGNLIMDKTLFQKNATNNKIYLIWDGRNRNGRYVGTGTYLALITWIKDNKNSITEKRMIGVKR